MAVLPSHLFVELTSLDELSFPTSTSTRVKYTCISASPHYLAVGSTSGTVYLFSRYAAKFRKSLSSVPVQVIACKEGAVDLVKASPNEKHLAVATTRGHISVVSLSGSHPSVVLNNTLHLGQSITHLCWSEDSSRLYAGDSIGRISSSKIASRNVFRAACEFVLELDSSVVQMDTSAHNLLISTVSRCYLYNSARGNCSQIGKKLRSGQFGACFFPSKDDSEPLIFSGRPGSRIWEVDTDGVVYSTHHFSNLSSAPTVSLVTFRRHFQLQSQLPAAPPINFEKLDLICGIYLLTVNGSQICVVDPRKATVVILCRSDEEALQYSVCGNDLFMLTRTDGTLKKLSLFTIEKAVDKLHWRECFMQAGQVVSAFASTFQRIPWKPDVIKGILNHLKTAKEVDELNDTTPETLQALISHLMSVAEQIEEEKKQGTSPAKSAVRLSTGVHRVLRFMENSGYEDDFTFRAPSPLRNSMKHKSRSTPMMDRADEIDGFSAKDAVTKRKSVPLDTPTLFDMTASRSAESLLTLVSRLPLQPSPVRHLDDDLEDPHTPTPDTPEIQTPDSPLEDELPVKSVHPAGDYVRIIPVQETLEDKMLRSLELGGKKVLGSVQKMAQSLALDDLTQQSRARKPLQVDIRYPQNWDEIEHRNDEEITPLVPMPEVPAVVQRKRGRRRKQQPQNNGRIDRMSPNNFQLPGLSEDSSISREFQNPKMKATIDELNNSQETTPLTPEASNGNIPLFPNQQNVVSNKKQDRQNFWKRTSTTISMSSSDQQDGDESDRFIEDLPILSVPVTDKKSGKICTSCGLHRSWILIPYLCKITGRIHVSPQCIEEGGVPGSESDWKEVLKAKVKMESISSTVNQVCEKCRKAMDMNLDEECSINPSESIHKVAKTLSDIPPEQLVEMFSSFATPQENPNPSCCETTGIPNSEGIRDEMVYSTYINPAYDSSIERLDGGGSSWEKGRGDWLSLVPFSHLITTATCILGSEAMERILLEEVSVLTFFKDDDWKCFAKAIAVEEKQTQNQLSTLHGTLMEDLLQTPQRLDCSHTATAVQIDVSGLCGYCTLPVSTKVSERKQNIRMFPCGHLFHQVCLDGQTSLVCVECSMVSAEYYT